MESDDCERMSDAELLAGLKALVAGERRGLVRILRRLAEVDRRDLPQKTGYPSLFMFCLSELGYSEGAAYRRIHAARAARRWPVIYEMLSSGAITLSVVSMLAPCLRAENHRELLSKAAGKNKREVDALLAELRPAVPPADSIRRLGPAPTLATDSSPAGDPEAPGLFASAAPAGAQEEARGDPAPRCGADASPGAATSPPSADTPLVRFSFTGDESLLTRLRRAQELLRHRQPDGRPAAIFALALDALLDRIDPERIIRRASMRRERRLARAAARAEGHGGPPQRTRRVPAGVRREVWERDEGRCSFVAASGRRCGARSLLELDHIQPFALGGRSDDPDNVRLRCRAHNLFGAREVFGQDAVPRRAEADGPEAIF